MVMFTKKNMEFETINNMKTKPGSYAIENNI